MLLLGVLAATAIGRMETAPVLWVNPQGKVLVQDRPVREARLTRGAVPVETPFGLGLDFNGTHGGLLLPDLPALALADSMTVSTWVYLRGYVQSGPGAQIFFRGDDRNGLDPYCLTVHSDGNVNFGISDAKNGVDVVAAKVPLNKWIHITASFDAALCEIKLWINDALIKTEPTLHQPFLALSKSNAPGVGIGNVQNDKGPHNQPLNGIVADLRLYDAALKPAEAGWHPYVAK